MQQKIGIKIEGPTEEKLPFIFTVFFLLTTIFILMTIVILGAEFLNIPIPILNL